MQNVQISINDLKPFFQKLQKLKDLHHRKTNRNLYFFVLSEERWGHDLAEYLCAIKHASDNNYDLAFMCIYSRNAIRLRHISIENINPDINIDFIDVKQILKEYINKDQFAEIKTTLIQDASQLKSWLGEKKLLEKYYSDGFWWPYSIPLRFFIHQGNLCHPYFYLWEMNRKKYDGMISSIISSYEIKVVDKISPKAQQMAHNLFPELNIIREDSYNNDKIVIGFNIRSLNLGKRDTSLETFKNIVSILEKINSFKQARVVFFASRIKLGENFVSGFSKVKFSFIDSYNDNWYAFNKAYNRNEFNSFQQYIALEQLLIRYSNIVIVPDSGGGLLPIAMGKVAIMCDAYTQTSPMSKVLYLPKGIVDKPNSSSSEMLTYALQKGLSNPEVNPSNSLAQLFSALQFACAAYEKDLTISSLSENCKYDPHLKRLDEFHFQKFSTDTEYSRGITLNYPRFQVERNGELIHY